MYFILNFIASLGRAAPVAHYPAFPGQSSGSKLLVAELLFFTHWCNPALIMPHVFPSGFLVLIILRFFLHRFPGPFP